MKWEPAAAMILLIALGFWIVWSPGVNHDLRPGARLVKFSIGSAKGNVEVVPEPAGGYSFRLLGNRGHASPVLSEDQFRAMYGEREFAGIVANAGNDFFRLLNVSSWFSVAWVAVGFVGQLAFFGRMWVQWVVSEKRRQSVVPESFWWLSLVGSVMLFTYFVWRQDAVGVLGQTSGVVIYARNIRLIHKNRRRAARHAARATAATPASAAADPAPEPSLEPDESPAPDRAAPV